MKTNLILVLFAAFLLAAVSTIAAMFVSLSKQGDERRKMILEKTSAQTFAITILYLLFSLGESIYLALRGSSQPLNPFVVLTVISVIFAVELAYHKKKYGD